MSALGHQHLGIQSASLVLVRDNYGYKPFVCEVVGNWDDQLQLYIFLVMRRQIENYFGCTELAKKV